jgi:hypothetical protein
MDTSSTVSEADAQRLWLTADRLVVPLMRQPGG